MAEDAEPSLRVARDGVADDESVVEARVPGGCAGVGEETEPVDDDGVATRAGEEAEDGVVDGSRVAVVPAAPRPVEELEAEQQQRVVVGEPPRAVAQHGEDELLRERESLERGRLIGRERLVDRVERLERRGHGAGGLKEPVAEGGGDGGRGRGYGDGVLRARRKQRRERRERRRRRAGTRRGGVRREGVRGNVDEGAGEEAAAAGAAAERGEEDTAHGEPGLAVGGGQWRGRGRR